MKATLLRTIAILLIVTINVGCDQLSKTIVRQKISSYETISLLGNHLMLTKVENSGAFLSLGDSLPSPLRLILLVGLPLLPLAFGLWYLFRQTNLSGLTIAGICCVVGGGLGNLYDRLMYGSVTDFLHIRVGIFQTGIFNLADVSILIGVAILMSRSILQRTHTA